METDTSKVGEYTIDRPKYENVQQPCIASIIIQLYQHHHQFLFLNHFLFQLLFSYLKLL